MERTSIMFTRVLLTAAVWLAWTVVPAAAEGLGVGDPAPKLEVKEFVKGEPVKGLEKGKIYVVEFWATWCGPCRATIPHLTELQKKHKDVIFIGVSAFERDQGKVKPFVKEMGDKMDYRVAMDAVPEGKQGAEGKMAKNWMEAADQDGIPTAFIVNADGKIAWIGHPTELGEPLAKVVEGKFDLKTAAAEAKRANAQKHKLKELQEKLTKASQHGGPKEVVAVIDEAITADPDLEKTLGSAKFRILTSKGGDSKKALEYGKHLLETVYKDDKERLNDLAWSIVDPDGMKHDAKLTKLALQAALRADELAKHKDPAVADTLGKAYFDNGDAVNALETQQRAVKLAKGTPLESDKTMKDRLEQYKKAVNK
jgi:thiol-disulfide isomerase/thioredoxin